MDNTPVETIFSELARMKDVIYLIEKRLSMGELPKDTQERPMPCDSLKFALCSIQDLTERLMIISSQVSCIKGE